RGFTNVCRYSNARPPGISSRSIRTPSRSLTAHIVLHVLCLIIPLFCAPRNFHALSLVHTPSPTRTADPRPSSARLLDLRVCEGVCVRWAGLVAWEYMDGEPTGCQ
ncbi:unnamed protein product, partial [Pylaiella littoralis]